MKHFTNHAVAVGASAALGTLLAGCSFIAEPAPFSAHEFSPTKQAKSCESRIWWPLLDTATAIAGATWVLRANSDLDDAEPHTISAGNQEVQVPGNGGDVNLLKTERAIGWTALGVFGASAIYGFVAEARCSARHHAVLAPPPPTTAARARFPERVLGYDFGVQPAAAATVCVSQDGIWTHEGATGLCRPRQASAAQPEVELTFQLGVSSQIRLAYPAKVQTANRDYDALAGSLTKMFGPPQVDTPRLSATCAASLAGCLRAGEQPKGPMWHWPTGSVELVPVSRAGEPALEIRYSREDDASSR